MGSVSVGDAMCQALYPFVAHDQTGGRFPHDYGSDSHLEDTKQYLRDLVMSRNKGDVTILSRWFQIWQKVRPFFKDWSGLLVINAVMCVTKGYYGQFSELQLFRTGEPEQIGSVDAGVER